MGYPEWLAGESQAVESSDINCLDETLLCKEIFDSGLNYMSDGDFASGTNDLPKNGNASYGIADLENLELDTPPDFQLSVSLALNPSAF